MTLSAEAHNINTLITDIHNKVSSANIDITGSGANISPRVMIRSAVLGITIEATLLKSVVVRVWRVKGKNEYYAFDEEEDKDQGLNIFETLFYMAEEEIAHAFQIATAMAIHPEFK